MQRSAEWLGARLKTAAGRSVTYTRSGQSLSVTGWPARHDYEVDDDDGIPRRVTFHDWTFAAADLDFTSDSTPFAARPGDQITETLDGVELTYEVMPIDVRPPSEWLDTAGELILIHCKLVRRA